MEDPVLYGLMYGRVQGHPDRAARLLLAQLGPVTGLFTTAEEALLRQWLRTLTEQFGQVRTTPRPASGG